MGNLFEMKADYGKQSKIGEVFSVPLMILPPDAKCKLKSLPFEFITTLDTERQKAFGDVSTDTQTLLL
jgi:hypothetical protein